MRSGSKRTLHVTRFCYSTTSSADLQFLCFGKVAVFINKYQIIITVHSTVLLCRLYYCDYYYSPIVIILLESTSSVDSNFDSAEHLCRAHRLRQPINTEHRPEATPMSRFRPQPPRPSPSCSVTGATVADADSYQAMART